MSNVKSATTGAVFFQQKNFNGPSFEYKEREVVYNLPPELNDTFLSVDIRDLSIVHGWRHYGDSQPGQIYKVWTQSQPDISDIQGLSKFVVAPADSELLAVRLINKSGNNSLDYVFIQTYTIDNPVNIPVNGDFEIVGLVPNDGRMYVTSIILFDKNKVPMEIGAAYFMYDAQGKGLKAVTYSETFPDGWKLERNNNYRFDLIINSITSGKNGVAVEK
ncbi:TPA: beta/gamma crystallin domain-containing protein [Enterobacter hormaechei]